MKTFLTWILSGKQPENNQLSATILFFRLFTGLIMLPYGLGKISNFDTYAADFFGDPIGIGMIPSLILTIFAQVGCSICIALGLQTRIASIILGFNMMIAVKFHFYDPFFDKALPLIFGGIYLMLTLIGSGKYSLDYILLNKFRKEEKVSFNKREISSIICMVIAFFIFWNVFVRDNICNIYLILFNLILATSLLILSFIISNKQEQ